MFKTLARGLIFNIYLPGFDASGRPIKRSGMDTFGPLGFGSLDEEVFGGLEVPHVTLGQKEVPVHQDELKPVPVVPMAENVLHPEVLATESVRRFNLVGRCQNLIV